MAIRTGWIGAGSDPLDPKSMPDIRPPGYLVTPPVSIWNKTQLRR